MKNRICLWVLSSSLSVGCGSGVDGPGDVEPGSSDDAKSLAPDADRLTAMRQSGVVIDLDALPARRDKAAAWSEHYVDYGTYARLGKFVPDYLCVLTGAKGAFKNNTRSGAHLVYDKAPGHSADSWRVMNDGSDNYVASWTVCSAWSNFLEPYGSVAWVSTGARLSTATSENHWVATETWWGDAATFISGLGGEFDGGGESVRIIQATSATLPSNLRISTQAGSFQNPTVLAGSSYSTFIGIPNAGRLVSLLGYVNGNVTRGNVNTPGTFEFNVSTISGYSTFWLAPVDSGLCYLTKFSGDFEGGAEELRIRPAEGWWYLQAKRGGYSAIGSARCMAYDQR